MEMKQFKLPLAVQGLEDNGIFSGYASVFNVLDKHQDVIMQGAFARTIAERTGEIKLLWQHQPSQPIGVITHLKEDQKGLYMEGQLLLDIVQAKEAWVLLKHHAINGLSIGYKAVGYEYDHAKGVRYLTDIDLYEISLVTFPANGQAGVMKLKTDVPSTVREFEHFLRDAGFSRNEAKAIASEGFRRCVGEAAMAEDDALMHSLERALRVLSEMSL